ncbi:Hypothetical_protein [Hexamita inflata]|uniref:Hypothetical_protein n=1 Tax=Hexamita inflata TaxID=28002 RepID=A0AA86U1B0_9EUKA|nr:Hypothetical protein HINF_LOCUS24149 [Hexamita inflata]
MRYAIYCNNIRLQELLFLLQQEVLKHCLKVVMCYIKTKQKCHLYFKRKLLFPPTQKLLAHRLNLLQLRKNVKEIQQRDVNQLHEAENKNEAIQYNFDKLREQLQFSLEHVISDSILQVSIYAQLIYQYYRNNIIIYMETHSIYLIPKMRLGQIGAEGKIPRFKVLPLRIGMALLIQKRRWHDVNYLIRQFNIIYIY